jgi:hypothetical protein
VRTGALEIEQSMVHTSEFTIKKDNLRPTGPPESSPGRDVFYVLPWVGVQLQHAT